MPLAGARPAAAWGCRAAVVAACSARCRCSSPRAASSPTCRSLGVPLPWLLLGVVGLPGAAWPPPGVYVRAGRARRARLRRARRVPSERQPMTGGPPYGVAAVALVCVATVAVGALGLRLSRTTCDFYVASRAVVARGGTPPRSAASTCRPRRSSASPGWSSPTAPTCCGTRSATPPATSCCCCSSPRRCAAPAPTRCPTSPRPGSGSRAVRRIASVLVVVIGWLYLLPQLQGAGLTLQTVTGAPGGSAALVVGGRRRQRRRRRHAQHHLRAGLPVLAEAHRARRARAVPRARLAARRGARRCAGPDATASSTHQRDGRRRRTRRRSRSAAPRGRHRSPATSTARPHGTVQLGAPAGTTASTAAPTLTFAAGRRCRTLVERAAPDDGWAARCPRAGGGTTRSTRPTR